MKDVQIGFAAQPAYDKIDELLEGAPLLSPVVGPEGMVNGLSGHDLRDTEQVLEAAVSGEGIALHIEEEVGRRRRRKETKAKSRPDRRKELEGGPARLALKHLKAGLLAEPHERVPAHCLHGLGRRQRGQSCHSANAGCHELASLATRHVRHQRKMVVVAPALQADLIPSADAAVLDGIGIYGNRATEGCLLKTQLDAPVVGRVVLKPEPLLSHGSEYDVDCIRLDAL